ncbi:MAG: signal peptidase I [Promethearchaeota archaeon]|nr:MAG: signal peptidase I [Candidatus Lokiarchaeota archaeon]
MGSTPRRPFNSVPWQERPFILPARSSILPPPDAPDTFLPELMQKKAAELMKSAIRAKLVHNYLSTSGEDMIISSIDYNPRISIVETIMGTGLESTITDKYPEVPGKGGFEISSAGAAYLEWKGPTEISVRIEALTDMIEGGPDTGLTREGLETMEQNVLIPRFSRETLLSVYAQVFRKDFPFGRKIASARGAVLNPPSNALFSIHYLDENTLHGSEILTTAPDGTLEVTPALLKELYAKLLNGEPLTSLETLALDGGLYLKNPAEFTSLAEEAARLHVPSQSIGPSMVNKIENIKENQGKIGLIHKLKKFFRRRIGVNVIGYSMSGIFEHGDIVGAKKVTRFTRYSIGDIIVFKNKDGEKVIHMIVGFTRENGKKQYRTWGVNNQELDENPVARQDIVGKVVLSAKEQYKILAQVKEGSILVVDANGMVQIGENTDTKEKRVLFRFTQFLEEHTQFSEDLDPFFSLIERRVDTNRKIEINTLKEIFRKIHGVQINGPVDLSLVQSETYRNLIDVMAEIEPYFWLDLSSEARRYLKETEPRISLYYDEVRRDPSTQNINFYYNSWNNDYDVQVEILSAQWHDRCSYEGIPLGPGVTRHHLRLGDQNKADCCISALVPVMNHIPWLPPHRDQWTQNFEDAKQYIERGIAYVPRWWPDTRRVNYIRFLNYNNIPYHIGTVNFAE